jgi:hypothetical protein
MLVSPDDGGAHADDPLDIPDRVVLDDDLVQDPLPGAVRGLQPQPVDEVSDLDLSYTPPLGSPGKEQAITAADGQPSQPPPWPSWPSPPPAH